MLRPRILALAPGLLALAIVFGTPARAVLAADAKGTAAGAGASAKHSPTAAAEHPAADGEHAPAEEKIDILALEFPLAVWTVIVFLVLLFVLSKLAFKPLLAAMQNREEHLERTLQETERARAESERLMAEHRSAMAQAADQARSILEDARKAAEATANDIIQKAQAEAEAARARAEREIGTARDQALMEIWSQTANLAVSVAGRVLSRELNEGDQRRLIDTAMAELPAAPTPNGQGGRRA